MRIIQIKKRSGGTRTIYAPSKGEKSEFKALLATIPQPAGLLRYAHGFMGGRNIVTNTQPHAGKTMTISMDLSNFFDSVRPSMVRGRVPTAVIDRCFLFADGTPGTTEDCRARQGLPTSPALANLAAIAMDEAILKKLKKMGIAGAVYTRYADDLSISMDCDDQTTAQAVVAAVADIVSRCGFRLNPRKTRIKRATGGHRECCGVMATTNGVAVSRRTRRAIRAAQHNLDVARATGQSSKTVLSLTRKLQGLREFSTLKTPRRVTDRERTDAVRLADATKLAANFALRPPQPCRKLIADQDLGDSVMITTDPAMIYGMSAYTTGWTSCMAIVGQHSYAYHRGVPFWQRLTGVSLAYLDSRSTMTLAGVTRPKMAARALIYQLRDGRRCYGDIYSGGNHSLCPTTEPGKKLQAALEAAGIPAASTCSGALVEGNVKQPCPLPYFDNSNVETVTLAESKSKAYRVRIR